MPETSELHLAVALDGAGWHPAAWRSPDARPRELFSAGHWTDLAREAEAGALDFLTIEDSLGPQAAGRFAGPDDRTDQVRGRLDAVLTAARIAPHTARIGLVPTAVTTHTEPFHLSTSIATLDHVSEGRAGWRPRVAASPGEARHFGRREFPALTADNVTDPAVVAHLRDLFDEAADAVEVVRRLWDSWEDDAAIRDVPTGLRSLWGLRRALARQSPHNLRKQMRLPPHRGRACRLLLLSACEGGSPSWPTCRLRYRPALLVSIAQSTCSIRGS